MLQSIYLKFEYFQILCIIWFVMGRLDERIKQYMEKNNLELAGHVGINTATMIIADPVEVIESPRYEKYVDESLKSYGNEPYRQAFNGIECMTGYGDGDYPVFVQKDDDGRIIEMRIRFDITYGFTEKDGKMHYASTDEMWNTVLERDVGKDPLA